MWIWEEMKHLVSHIEMRFSVEYDNILACLNGIQQFLKDTKQLYNSFINFVQLDMVFFNNANT